MGSPTAPATWTPRVTKQFAAIAVALALWLVGCGLEPETDLSVRLLTYDGSCYVGNSIGLLVADPRYGTSVLWDAEGPEPRRPGRVAWRPGYSGRYAAGGEIEVVAPDGRVVAVTGRRYVLMGGGVTVGEIGAWGVCDVFVAP